MKERVFNSTGMKQIIDSGYKLFDNQTNLLSTGNVISNTQYSNYVRPYDETECNNMSYPKGHLMQYDLKFFKNVPDEILSILKSEGRKSSYVLYEFFVCKSYGKDVLGYVLTDENEKLIKTIVCYGPFMSKRIAAVVTARDYVCDFADVEQA